MHVEDVSLEEITKFQHIVTKTGFLSSLPQDVFTNFILSLKKVTVQAGELLIKEGDIGESLFILIQGRLRVYSKELLGIADISQGDIIGELSVLTSSDRSNTVRAIRDSILLEFDYSAFSFLEKNYPVELLRIARQSLIRQRNQKHFKLPGENAKTFVIIPSSVTNPQEFVEDLSRFLNRSNNIFLINESEFNAQFKGKNEHSIIEWMNDLENKYSLVIYVGEGSNNSWTQRIIRCADRVILVSDFLVSKELNASESFLFALAKDVKPYIDLVLLHPSTTKIIRGTLEWLKNRAVNIHHHVQMKNVQHFERLVRFITGRAVGLVLSGGSARAIAHLGVIKALEEMGIPIDFIAGSSMGAVVAAGYGMFGLEKTGIKIKEEYAIRNKNRFTLPVESIVTGRLESKTFQYVFGDTCIEDMWVHFFCVATDIAHYKLKVFNQGEVWKSLRTTVSLPAILPPIYTSTGEILVDGSILNNLPVDVMRPLLTGGYIIAVICNQITGQSHPPSKEESYSRSGWRLLWDKFTPFGKKKPTNLSFISIIFRTFNATTMNNQLYLESLADCVLHLKTLESGFLDYYLYEKIYERAYQEAKEKLPSLLENLP